MDGEGSNRDDNDDDTMRRSARLDRKFIRTDKVKAGRRRGEALKVLQTSVNR